MLRAIVIVAVITFHEEVCNHPSVYEKGEINRLIKKTHLKVLVEIIFGITYCRTLNKLE